MASTTASQTILTRQSTPNQSRTCTPRSTTVSVLPILLATRASGPHPFPFRTRSLSPTAPMVLRSRERGRVGRRRHLIETPLSLPDSGAFRVVADLRPPTSDLPPPTSEPRRSEPKLVLNRFTHAALHLHK